jgi:hypothetical protein
MTDGNERKSSDNNQEGGNQPLYQPNRNPDECWFSDHTPGWVYRGQDYGERRATVDDVRTLLARAVYESGAKFQQLFVDNAKLVTVQGDKMMVGGGFPSLPPQVERFGVR